MIFAVHDPLLCTTHLFQLLRKKSNSWSCANTHAVPKMANDTPKIITKRLAIYSTDFSSLIFMWHANGNITAMKKLKVHPRSPIILVKDGIKIENKTAKKDMIHLAIFLFNCGNVSSNCEFTGVSISPYFVRGFKAISHKVNWLKIQLNFAFDMDFVILLYETTSESTLYPNIRYPRLPSTM